MILIFLGPPGCGKGTQAQLLATEQDFLHLSTGDLLRAEMEAQTELGKRIKDIYNAGGLVPSEIVVDLVQKLIAQAGTKSILCDGFPRTVDQAVALDKILSAAGKVVGGALYFSLSEESILRRVLGRLTCADCKKVYHEITNPPAVPGVCDGCGGRRLEKRADDSEESLKVRLAAYHDATKPLIDFYKEKNVLSEINASQSVEEVKQQILEKIKPYLGTRE